MTRFLLLAILTAALAGCRFFENAHRVLVDEPLDYCEPKDRQVSRHRAEELAEQAWEELQRQCPGSRFSEDYEEGFEYGFAEYIYAGGQALPPPLPLPPRDYWTAEYRTAAGHVAVEQWFSGFFDGRAAAEASSYRRLETVPSALAIRPAGGFHGPVPLMDLGPFAPVEPFGLGPEIEPLPEEWDEETIFPAEPAPAPSPTAPPGEASAPSGKPRESPGRARTIRPTQPNPSGPDFPATKPVHFHLLPSA